jgi:hypothetical protein
MPDDANEGKRTTVLARVERLRELLEENAEAAVLELAYHEVGRELDGLIRPGRAEGDEPPVSAEGETPPSF